ncbi:MAG: NUDIX domain-containing protein [Pseudomonadales bacterium]
MARDRFPVVVHVLLRRPAAAGSEVFLLRRSGTGFMDGYHVPPGGHLSAGEGVLDAARRECQEETGATPGQLTPLCVLPYRSGRHQGFNFVFAGSSWDRAPGLGEPSHSDRAAWHPLAGLPDPHAPWLDDVLDLERGGEWFRELYWP